MPERISKLSKLDHHYIPAEVATIAGGSESNFQSRYIRSKFIRYKRMPRQVLLTAYSIVSYLLNRLFAKHAHDK